MKHLASIVFISVFITVYSLVNYYLFVKGYRILPAKSAYRYVYTTVFLFFAAQFILSRPLLSADIPLLSKTVFALAGVWLAAMLYFFLIALCTDLVRLADYFFHFLPDLTPYKFKIFSAIVAGVACLLLVGNINAKQVKINHLTLNIAKKSTLSHLKIALVSDIHFGTLVDAKDIQKMFNLIKEQNPDILLIAGDLIDEGVTEKKLREIIPLFRQFEPKYGKIAVLGNHEYINDIEKSKEIYKQLGVTLLIDSVLSIPNAFTIIGRDDKSNRMGSGNQPRKPLDELLGGTDFDLPVILLDHQPFHLSETARYPVDLQLSGHTHHGQLFPLNRLTSAIYEKSWGYAKIKDTHFYISSGFGTWGPRMRLGSRAEMAVVDVRITNYELKIKN
jgi:predicted MPP superfamily phosphohydrolase